MAHIVKWTLMLVALLALALTPLVASAAPGTTTFNEKFVFTGQTIGNTDGTTTGNVTVRAASKQTGSGDQFTVCDYFTADDAFLGQFESAAFASSNPDDVLSFCLANASDRAA